MYRNVILAGHFEILPGHDFSLSAAVLDCANFSSLKDEAWFLVPVLWAVPFEGAVCLACLGTTRNHGAAYLKLAGKMTPFCPSTYIV